MVGKAGVNITVTMQSVLGGLICEPDVAQESISETEDIQLQTSRANG